MRKQHFITSVFLISALGVFSQNEYFSGDPKWYVNEEAIGSSFERLWEIVGDTTIENNVYKRFQFQSAPPYAQYFFTYASQTSYFSFVRSDNKTMWWRNNNTMQDELLYRFEGEVGDTLELHPGLRYDAGVIPENDPDHFIIDAVDSVLIGSEYRKIFHCGLPWCAGSSYVFEGIGSCSGPWYYMYFPWQLTWIICFGWEGVAYGGGAMTIPYPTTLEPDNCYPFNVEESDVSLLKIVPNPASQFIRFAGDGLTANSKFKIFNSFGQMVLSGYNRSQIDVSALSLGVYLAEVECMGKYLKTMLVKE
jgi:hypothetical protein